MAPCSCPPLRAACSRAHPVTSPAAAHIYTQHSSIRWMHQPTKQLNQVYCQIQGWKLLDMMQPLNPQAACRWGVGCPGHRSTCVKATSCTPQDTHTTKQQCRCRPPTGMQRVYQSRIPQACPQAPRHTKPLPSRRQPKPAEYYINGQPVSQPAKQGI